MFVYFVADCEPGWAQSDQTCYYIYEASDDKTVLKSWTDARDNCTSQGGHLLQLETKEELDFITHRFRQNVTDLMTRYGRSDRSIWTALNDIGKGVSNIFMHDCL